MNKLPQYVVFDMKHEIDEFMKDAQPAFDALKGSFTPERLLEVSLDQLLMNRFHDDMPVLSLYKNAQLAMDAYVPKDKAVPEGEVSKERLGYYCGVTMLAHSLNERIKRNRMRQNGDFLYGFEKVTPRGEVVLSLLWTLDERPIL